MFIQLDKVSKFFEVGGHKLCALSDIDLEIAKGEYCGFIGPVVPVKPPY